jgi:hypothetical protein
MRKKPFYAAFGLGDISNLLATKFFFTRLEE